MKILVDPILVGNLDFGIPWLYDAAKKFLKNFRVLFFADFLFFLNFTKNHDNKGSFNFYSGLINKTS